MKKVLNYIQNIIIAFFNYKKYPYIYNTKIVHAIDPEIPSETDSPPAEVYCITEVIKTFLLPILQHQMPQKCLMVEDIILKNPNCLTNTVPE